jgi:hypothetical protein
MDFKNLRLPDAATAHSRYCQEDELDKLISRAKSLIRTLEVTEYPLGIYSFTPTPELADVLVMIGTMLCDLKGYDKKLKTQYVEMAVEKLLNPLNLNSEIDSSYRYSVEVKNNTTYYMSITPEEMDNFMKEMLG